jgi:deoxyribose-phosphate aldolase
MTLADYSQIIACLDLTSLNHDDTPEKIIALCHKASTPLGYVAAICVYPQFVSLAWQTLINTNIRIATVANFPEGKDDITKVIVNIKQAILDGAAEIDVVIPYHAYALHHRSMVCDFIAQCKLWCGANTVLKTILETGALSPEEILMASDDAIQSGADFIKTSTGKIPVGTTLEAARIILQAIKKANHTVGFKVSGGIRTIEQAKNYIDLVKQIVGNEYFSPSHFRIGASGLLDVILEQVHAENC